MSSRLRGLCGIYTRDGPTAALHVIAGQRTTARRRNVQVVFDGRIYNSAELAQELPSGIERREGSEQAELIARVYEGFGIDGVHKLRGVFSFALLDIDRDRFYLVRDRLGVKPLYYAYAPQSIVFASRVAAIWSVADVTPRINLQALPYLLFGVRPAPQTLFEKILTVPHGHYLHVKGNDERVIEYWDALFPEQPVQPARSAADYADELQALLAETVQLYTEDAADARTALLLSGGLDSSVIGFLAADVPHLRTYTIAFKSAQHTTLDESAYARFVAKRLGSHHTEFDYKSVYVNAYFLNTLRESETPTYPAEIPNTIPFYLLNRRMKRDGTRVALAGTGADEILGGYPHHQIERIRRAVQARPFTASTSHLYRKVTGWLGEDHQFFQHLHGELVRTYGHNLASSMWIKGFAYIRDNFANFFSDEVLAALGPGGLKTPLDMAIDPVKYCRFHPFDQLLYIDIQTRLVDYLLLEENQIPQSFGIELRLPFLDHRVVEYAATIPPTIKMRGLTEKYVLKEIARRYLPADFFRREWRGFAAPYAAELFGSHGSLLVSELLSASALRRAGYLRPSFVEALLEQYPQQRNPTVKAGQEVLLERALLIQGIDYLFVKNSRRRPKLSPLLTNLWRKPRPVAL